MAQFSENGSASSAQWGPSIGEMRVIDGPQQYVQPHESGASTNIPPPPNGTFQRQAEGAGTVITRYPYGASWSYAPGLDHIRVPTVAPESLGYSSQPAYPTADGRRPSSPTQTWSAQIKEEPEDLTGHQRSKTKAEQRARQSTSQAGTQTSDSESDSDFLQIDDASSLQTQQLPGGAAGIRKRKITGLSSSAALSSVTTAELQKRPGIIPLTSNLAGPVQVLTAKDGAKLYSCPECNLFYADHLAFEIHLQAHGVSLGKRHLCKECGTSFRRREHLDAHMTAHSEDRPYSCETCGKAFKRNEHLTRHRVLHTGDKQHSCPECGKAFFRKDHLVKHTQTHLMRKLNSGEG